MKLVTGDLVKVTITNVEVLDPMYDGSFRGVAPHVQYSSRSMKKENEIYFTDTYSNVIIERAGGTVTGRISSARLDPQPGDVYKADGRVWYVRENVTVFGNVLITNGAKTFTDDRHDNNDSISDFSLLNPVLVSRAGKSVE